MKNEKISVLEQFFVQPNLEKTFLEKELGSSQEVSNLFNQLIKFGVISSKPELWFKNLNGGKRNGTIHSSYMSRQETDSVPTYKFFNIDKKRLALFINKIKNSMREPDFDVSTCSVVFKDSREPIYKPENEKQKEASKLLWRNRQFIRPNGSFKLSGKPIETYFFAEKIKLTTLGHQDFDKRIKTDKKFSQKIDNFIKCFQKPFNASAAPISLTTKNNQVLLVIDMSW